MKAEEYVELFKKEIAEGKPEKEVLVGILKLILEDTQILVAKRKAVKNSQMAACFETSDEVWRSFCKRLPDKSINQDAFVSSIKRGNPSLFATIVYEGKFKEYMRRQEMLAKLAKKIKSL